MIDIRIIKREKMASVWMHARLARCTVGWLRGCDLLLVASSCCMRRFLKLRSIHDADCDHPSYQRDPTIFIDAGLIVYATCKASN